MPTERTGQDWEAYRWPQVEMRWAGEDGVWLCRWREFPSALVDGATREEAFAALVSLTPTLMCAFADLPRADVRDKAEVALARVVELEEKFEARTHSAEGSGVSASAGAPGERMVYETQDIILPDIPLPSPCAIRITIDPSMDYIALHLGNCHRDWSWRLGDGRFVGAGGCVSPLSNRGALRLEEGEDDCAGQERSNG